MMQHPAAAHHRIAIVGSREYAHLERVREYVRTLPLGVIVVSGGARGVDRVAADEARKCKLRVQELVPDWDRFGKSAGFQRNQAIVDAADEVVAFWDGESRGTADTIDRANRKGIPVKVVH